MSITSSAAAPKGAAQSHAIGWPVVPGLEDNSLNATLLRAALFGLITYAIYDPTNLSTVKNWPLLITVVDMAWGTVLSVAVSYVGFIVGKSLA